MPKEQPITVHCPRCGEKFAFRTTQRICAACEKPIRRNEKWYIVDSAIRHRNCQDPTSYAEPEEQKS